MTGWLNLQGKTAIVTGAASGMGTATAVALAEAGANVVLADVTADALHALQTTWKDAR